MVYQDCRGTFRSGGEFTPMLNEAGDGADTVAWLLAQDWCDGSIGTFGPSYLGFVQWAAASAGSDLRAIAPAVTTTDYYSTPWYSEGGALSLHAIHSWTTLMALMGHGRPARSSSRGAAGFASGRCWRSSGRGGRRSWTIRLATSTGATFRGSSPLRV